MKISYAIYELHSSLLKRKGALLKVTFASGILGYADCHPWPELGDLKLEEQLKNLAQGKLTPLLHSSLQLAQIDAQARSNGHPILKDDPIPLSHFLITSLLDWRFVEIDHLVKQGFTHLKIKMGRQLTQETEALLLLFSKTPLKLRLDFNEKLDFTSFRQFLDKIKKIQYTIDFIEDPFPFHLDDWKAIQNDGWILACDREAKKANGYPKSAQILVVKPAILTSAEWQTWTHQTRIVTSYLGHPLEQMAAAFVATQIDPHCEMIHGLASHRAYLPNSFSHYFNWQSPQFKTPPGFGFGFDDELQQLNWIDLIDLLRN